jgi:hypothetical protein
VASALETSATTSNRACHRQPTSASAHASGAGRVGRRTRVMICAVGTSQRDLAESRCACRFGRRGTCAKHGLHRKRERRGAEFLRCGRLSRDLHRPEVARLMKLICGDGNMAPKSEVGAIRVLGERCGRRRAPDGGRRSLPVRHGQSPRAQQARFDSRVPG